MAAIHRRLKAGMLDVKVAADDRTNIFHSSCSQLLSLPNSAPLLTSCRVIVYGQEGVASINFSNVASYGPEVSVSVDGDSKCNRAICDALS